MEMVLRHLSKAIIFCNLFVIGFIGGLATNEAHAIDPLRIDRPLTVVNLKEFIRPVDDSWIFSIQNASDIDLEFEVQRYPLRDPVAQLLGLETPIQGGLRFVVSDGSEVVSDWYQPDIVAISVPALSVQSFAVLSEMKNSERLWLWSQGERIKFEGSMRNIWTFILVLMATLFFVALVRSLGRDTGYCKVLLLDALGLIGVAALLKLQLLASVSAGSFVLPDSFAILLSSGALALIVAISTALFISTISHILLLRQRSADRSYWFTVRVVIDVVKFATIFLWSGQYFTDLDYEFLAPEILPFGLSLAASLILLGVVLRPSAVKLSVSKVKPTSPLVNETYVNEPYVNETNAEDVILLSEPTADLVEPSDATDQADPPELLR